MGEPREITVGLDAQGYRERRNIFGLPFEAVRFRRVRSVRAPLAWLNYRMRRRPDFALQHKFQDFDLSRVDLHHFFFSLSLGKRPWIVSTSSWLPRWDKLDRRGLELLAGDACRRIIPLSESAWAAQRHSMRANADLIPALERKVSVLHPAQELLVGSWDEKCVADDAVDFVFVGKHFFRKGGAAVLRVFDRLFDTGAAARLHIISSLEHGDHASRSTAEDTVEARRTIARHPGRILHHTSLSNAEVLKLLRRSHVALLPTIAETYGYFALEAQAAGCPVISTRVQALAEINDDEHGWSLDVPVNDAGRAQRATAAEAAAFDAALEERLETAVQDALEHPAQIRLKGERSLERVRRLHDPVRAARRLESIYREALDR